LADTLEQLSYSLYAISLQELSAPTPWNQETISLLYDLVYAAQTYNDAVTASRNVYADTLYELFNLEDAVNQAATRVLCGPVSPRIRDNFIQLKYYVEELLYQYRLDPTYDNGVAPLAGIIGGAAAGASSQMQSAFAASALGNLDIMACDSFSFRWAKPHDEVYWDIGLQNAQLTADQLVVGASSTNGRRGTNGIAGITSLNVYYTDGTAVDLVAQARYQRDPHVHTNGQLRLINDLDSITLPLDPRRSVETVYMKADSWLAPDMPVELSMSLARKSSVRPIPLMP
jgi:hypothetical protein